jgi:type I restriction enzyme S subunit
MISDISKEEGKYISKTRDKVTEEGAKKSRYLKAGILILSNSGTVCVPKILAVDGCIHDGFVAFPNFSENLEMLYLYYYFHHIRQKVINENRQGVTQVNLNTGIVREIAVPLAPFSEQRRIAGKIEGLFSFLDAGVESLRKVKAQLKRYRQAVLKYAFEGKLTEEWRKTHKDQIEPAQKLFEKAKQEIKKEKAGKFPELSQTDILRLMELPETWMWAPIRELETFIGSGITPRGGRTVYVQEGIPFIRSQNVHADGLRLEQIAHVTPKMHDEMKRTKTRPNDVLLNITGASIGRSAYVPEKLAEANVNQHVCIIRTGWWLVPAYLSYFLNSALGQAQIFSTQSGVTRQGLNYEQVRRLKIPLAPYLEQKVIVAKIEETYSVSYEVEKTIRQSAEYAKYLRQSILKYAFTGKLVPQDPNDEPAWKLLDRIKSERIKRGLEGSKSSDSYKSETKKQVELSRYVK